MVRGQVPFLLVAVVALAAACSTDDPAPSSSPTPSIETTTEAPPLVAETPSGSSSPSVDVLAIVDASVSATIEGRSTRPAATPPTPIPEFQPDAGDQLAGTVVRVIDGDTVHVLLQDGTTDRVRLLGVDTPETFAPNNENEYTGITDTKCLDDWGHLATEFATKQLNGRTVTLLLDPVAGERGSFGRLLAYVLVEGQDFNALLVERGYARVYTEGNSVREPDYLELQEMAQKSNFGLWQCRGLPGRDSSPTQTPTQDGPRYDPFGPDRDCGDFETWDQAQEFFEAAGGPARDPHRLDGDQDGIPCEVLPGAPPRSPAPEPTPTNSCPAGPS